MPVLLTQFQHSFLRDSRCQLRWEVPACHVGDPEGMPGSRLCPGPALALVGFQRVEDLSTNLSVSLPLKQMKISRPLKTS